MNRAEKDKEFNYALISFAELMPGFEKSKVIKNLAHVTQLESEKIENKFFNKDNREIKIVTDLDKARRYQGKFLRAGLAVVIQMNFNNDFECT